MCNLFTVMGHNHVKIGTTTEGIDFSQEHEVRRLGDVRCRPRFALPLRSSKGYVEGEYVDDDTGELRRAEVLSPSRTRHRDRKPGGNRNGSSWRPPDTLDFEPHTQILR